MFAPSIRAEATLRAVTSYGLGTGEMKSDPKNCVNTFINPVASSSLNAHAYGVRYPRSAVRELESASIVYRGWLPNFKVPEVFSRFRATIHVPRRPYTQALPGIPTIRPFEALACGIPLISAPWQDTEGLFRFGQDFLMARNGSEMQKHLTNCAQRFVSRERALRRTDLKPFVNAIHAAIALTSC